MIHINQTRKIHSSGSQFIFLTMQLLCGCIIVRSTVLQGEQVNLSFTSVCTIILAVEYFLWDLLFSDFLGKAAPESNCLINDSQLPSASWLP